RRAEAGSGGHRRRRGRLPCVFGRRGRLDRRGRRAGGRLPRRRRRAGARDGGALRRTAGRDAACYKARVIELAEGIEQAIEADRPVVALETTLVAHGFPAGQGVAVGRASEAAVRSTGAVPATVGVLDGAVRVGLADAELERFDARARKAGPSTIAAAVAAREVGATTVGGTLVACRAAGIRVLATGGIGGVHRGWDRNPDVSGDLAELARTPAVVVCSGVKSLLDVPATVELLETLGVPGVGWQTDSLPLFYSGDAPPPPPPP